MRNGINFVVCRLAKRPDLSPQPHCQTAILMYAIARFYSVTIICILQIRSAMLCSPPCCSFRMNRERKTSPGRIRPANFGHTKRCIGARNALMQCLPACRRLLHTLAKLQVAHLIQRMTVQLCIRSVAQERNASAFE